MNLQNICNLIKEAGLSKAIITLDTDGENVNVLLNIPTGNGFNAVGTSDKEMALRTVLAIPLCVSGEIAEVDNAFDNDLAEYGQGFASLSQAVTAMTSNASSTMQKQQDALKGKNAKKKTTAIKSPTKKKVEVEKVEEKIEIPANEDLTAFTNAPL